MVIVPMAKLVSQDCFHTIDLGILNECVIHDDVLAPGKTKEVSIGMR